MRKFYRIYNIQQKKHVIFIGNFNGLTNQTLMISPNKISTKLLSMSRVNINSELELICTIVQMAGFSKRHNLKWTEST